MQFGFDSPASSRGLLKRTPIGEAPAGAGGNPGLLRHRRDPGRGSARSAAALIAAALAALALVASLSATPAVAYSALTHEAIVDAAWDDGIRPLLLEKYAGASADELRAAHAYAYGGCILQDMGYYPFGNALFTELLHYVRSGDFVAALVNDAEPIEEYAFALGALEHYVADSTGHAMATNVAVPMYFPKLERKFGRVVTYEDDPSAHLKIEFGFDVLQVARGRYTSEADHAFIGFAVAPELLQRVFWRIYGIDVRDLFGDLDLAIRTYRRSVGTIVPEATKIAWEMKGEEIMRANPSISREQFVYAPPAGSFEKEWGDDYLRPSWLDAVLAFVLRFVPKFGRLSALDVVPLGPDAEALFERSFDASVARYEEALRNVAKGPLALEDVNLDTGEPTEPGAYSLADKAYAKLVDRLADEYFATVTPELRDELIAFYREAPSGLADDEGSDRARGELVALQSASAAPRCKPASRACERSTAGSDALAP